jgi:hypothetical protein
VICDQNACCVFQVSCAFFTFAWAVFSLYGGESDMFEDCGGFGFTVGDGNIVKPFDPLHFMGMRIICQATWTWKVSN